MDAQADASMGAGVVLGFSGRKQAQSCARPRAAPEQPRSHPLRLKETCHD